MPAAVVDLDSTDKFNLKSCPGGFVVLRKMTYGQKLIRQQNAMKVTMQMQRRGQKKDAGSGSLEMLTLQSTLFDFKTCVVEHNLEDKAGNLLNLSTDFDVQRLDPIIGEEISTRIDEMNNFEPPEDEGGNSGGVSDAQS